MNPVVYKEDQQKLKAIAVKTIPIALIVAFAGLIALIIVFTSNMGYIGGALFASLGALALVGGGMAFLNGIKMASRIGKPSETIISADDKGVMINTGESTNQSIAWQDIESFKPAQKGLQSGVAIILKDPAKYLNALSQKEKATAKQNEKILGSYASVNTKACSVSKEDIANELNNCLQAIKV